MSPKEEFMDKFYVWLMPEAGKVLVEDRGVPQVLSMDLTEYYANLVKQLGGNKSFSTWEEALSYGNGIALKMGWILDMDNKAGRFMEDFYDIND
jgi:hypothetical protein